MSGLEVFLGPTLYKVFIYGLIAAGGIIGLKIIVGVGVLFWTAHTVSKTQKRVRKRF